MVEHLEPLLLQQELTYDPETGVLVINIGSHSLTTSNTITIADSGIVFTCTADNNQTTHPYPRSTDPASGQALSITAVTGTTVTVNVGAANVTIDYVTIPSSAEFAWGGNPFTMDIYVNPAVASLSGTHTLVDMRASGANEVASRLYLDGAN